MGTKREKERKERKEIRRKWDKVTSGKEENGGKFPPLLDQFG